jgi:hypothetical protein
MTGAALTTASTVSTQALHSTATKAYVRARLHHGLYRFCH